MACLYAFEAVVASKGNFAQCGARNFVMVPSPAPCVAKPERWENMQLGRFGTAIAGGDADQDILGTCLGIFYKHVKIAIFSEDARIEQLVLGRTLAALTVRFNQVPIREGTLRVFIKHLHVRMGRRGIEIKIIFLYVFAMVAFRA